MKKIADFIVKNRIVILILFIILSFGSVILVNKVNINDDISKYLPSTSETRVGMDIMEKNFEEIKSSNLNVMFKDLDQDKKSEVLDYITNIKGVSSVDYDESEEYNKDGYTLYVINVLDSDDSTLASNVYNDISNHFSDYEMYTSGSIADKNKELLPMWIMVLSIGCAVVILTIMCESFIEPILFLVTILMAVLLNNGSNVMFSSVSNVTNSISAILQLALSMDYSIMLMDRYRQECKREKDKVKAMKNALYNAFKAISSSSLTTIVGLLALVFMSFTIGRDLGFVLAKGVLFSLICIFFVLPSLILLFDKVIDKTKKKVLNIKLDKVGRISYKFRYPATIIFVIIFVLSYLLKGSLGILYTDVQQDKIAQVFNENNQMVLIYNSKDEDKVASYINKLEKTDKVDTVLGYGNTINEELKYNDLNKKIKDMSSKVNIDDELIKILYYTYYNDNDSKMTLSEFTQFIKTKVLNNSTFKAKLNNEAINSINKLNNFTEPNLINKKRTITDICNILDLDKEKMESLLIYYNSKNNNIRLNLNEFISFMNKDVLTNKDFSKNIDSNTRSSLNTLSKFTNKNIIRTKMSSKDMAKLFGMSESSINDLYTYYVSTNEINIKMSISSFSNFVLNSVLTDNKYKNMFDSTMVNNIQMLKTFSNKNIITKNMTSNELALMFKVDESKVKQILLLKYSNFDNGSQLSMKEFIDNVTYIKNNTHYLDDLDISGFLGIDVSDTTKYSATQMSKILGIDIKSMYKIYALIDFVQNNTSNWYMKPTEFVSLMLKNSSSIDTATITKLNLVSTIMNSSVNDTKYSYRELAKIINVNPDITKSIYTLYTSKNTTIKISPQEFVNFVLTHKSDEMLSSNLTTNTINQLTLLQKVMKATLNNTKYSSLELSNLLGMNNDDVKLLYGLYDTKYIKSNQTLSLKEFVRFLLNDVMKNPSYSSNFNSSVSLKLNTINKIMTDSLNGVKYSKTDMFTTLKNLTNTLDENMIELLYIYYGSCNNYDANWTLTVEKMVNFLSDDIIDDKMFAAFINDDMKQSLSTTKISINDAKKLLIGNKYSRLIINTKLSLENDETFNFIQTVKDDLKAKDSEIYIIGDSPLAYEMSQTFQDELDFITILTMIAIFIVVALTFKSLIIPLILVLLIQCAVYMTMGILSFSGGKVYFIALLIVQSILMGATIDYAILYTTYYIEHRKTKNIKDSIISSYNKSINTILTSSSILVLVTFIVGIFSSGITSQICKTLSAGTLCSALLILVLLPSILGACDKIIIKKK